MENKQNGHHAPTGPIFTVATGDGIQQMKASQVVEMLEANAAQQAKANLAVGPVFRKVADDFRDWCKRCEPGNMFQAPEVQLQIIRMTCCLPVFTSLSDAARQKIAEQAEPKPKIVVG